MARNISKVYNMTLERRLHNNNVNTNTVRANPYIATVLRRMEYVDLIDDDGIVFAFRICCVAVKYLC